METTGGEIGTVAHSRGAPLTGPPTEVVVAPVVPTRTDLRTEAAAVTLMEATEAETIGKMDTRTAEERPHLATQTAVPRGERDTQDSIKK